LAQFTENKQCFLIQQLGDITDNLNVVCMQYCKNINNWSTAQ